MHLMQHQRTIRKIPWSTILGVSGDKIILPREFLTMCFTCNIFKISLHLNLNSLSY